jgi:osmotically-inducible protein OsmY
VGVLRRLLAVLVLLVIVGAAVYYWNARERTLEGPKEALGEVGAAISDKLQATKVHASVKAALELDRELGALPINVDGRDDGTVALKGDVPTAELRARAEELAASVPDVARVVNELQVNPTVALRDGANRTLGENLDDQAVVGKVKLAFSLNRGLKGTDIAVGSYRRQVTLSGQVDTPAQRDLAVELARRTPDVLGVVSDALTVRGQPVRPEASPVPPSSDPAPARPSASANRVSAVRSWQKPCFA